MFKCYLRGLERSFMKDKDITPGLVHRIACGKVLCVEFSLRATLALKERVGALSLQEHGPFGIKNDVLYAIRFSEGDSAVLMQKMSRDMMRRAQQPVALLRLALEVPWLSLFGGVSQARAQLAADQLTLAYRLLGLRGQAMMTKWLEAHALVERIAYRAARLTVYDAVKGEMAGTKELDLFYNKYVVPGGCGALI